jgi:hypothetical protein
MHEKRDHILDGIHRVVILQDRLAINFRRRSGLWTATQNGQFDKNEIAPRHEVFRSFPHYSVTTTPAPVGSQPAQRVAHYLVIDKGWPVASVAPSRHYGDGAVLRLLDRLNVRRLHVDGGMGGVVIAVALSIPGGGAGDFQACFQSGKHDRLQDGFWWRCHVPPVLKFGLLFAVQPPKRVTDIR